MRVFVQEREKAFLFLVSTYHDTCKRNAEVHKKVCKYETCCKEFVTPSRLKHQKIHDENASTNCQHCGNVYHHVDHLNKQIFECAASSHDSDDFLTKFN